MEKNNVDYTDLDRISIIPYGGTLTVTNVDLLIKKNIDQITLGDVNDDGDFNIADVVMMQKYLLNTDTLKNWKAGDLYEDNCIDSFDLCLMKKLLIQKLYS